MEINRGGADGDGADKVIRPSGKFDDVEPAQLPMAPDGGIVQQARLPEAKHLAAIPEHFICLRGPCRFFMEMHTIAEVITTIEVEHYVPINVNRMCTATPGVVYELDDDSVLSCNKWDPMEMDGGVAQRRKEFLAKNAGCLEADKLRLAARKQAYEEIEQAYAERMAAEARKTSNIATDAELAAVISQSPFASVAAEVAAEQAFNPLAEHAAELAEIMNDDIDDTDKEKP